MRTLRLVWNERFPEIIVGLVLLVLVSLCALLLWLGATDGVKCSRGHYEWTVRWDPSLNIMMPAQYFQCDEYVPAPEELE